MRALGYRLGYALFCRRERLALSALKAVAPRVALIEASAPSEAAWLRFAAAEPGQFAFLRLLAPGLPSGFRPLSIAGIDRAARRLRFLVKGRGAWSLALYDASPAFAAANPRAGDRLASPAGKADPWLVELSGPYGRFTLRHSTPRGCEGGPLVFIAGGIGIAPFLAMAAGLARGGAKRRLLILWAAGTREDLAGLDELIALAKANPAIRTIPILAHDPLWEGRTGHIDEAALVDFAGAELADPAASFWLCAPKPLRSAALKALRAQGVARRRIRVESFWL